jgi:hypothetical protein
MTARSATLQAKAALTHLGKHSDQVIQTQKKSKKWLRIRSGADGPRSGCGCYPFGLRSCIVYTIIK